MPSNNALVPPASEGPIEYRHVMQLVGRDLGDDAWGSAIAHTSYQSNTQFAHTIRNRGTGGHLNVLDSAAGNAVLQVADSGVFISTLSVTTLNIGTLNVSSTASLNGAVNLGDAVGDPVTVFGTLTDRENATFQKAVAVTGSLSVSGATSLLGGASIASGASVAGGLIVSSNGLSVLSGASVFSGTFTAQSNAALNGAITQIGDTTADSLLVIAAATFQDTAGTVAAYIDTANLRSIFGSSIALGSAANDKVNVVGGRLYVAASSEQQALGLRFSSAQTGTYYLGVTNTSSPSLLFKDNGGTTTVTLGDSAGTYQVQVTGSGRVTANWYAAGMAVGVTAFAGSEVFRVASGSSSLFGGSLTVGSGGISVTGASIFGAGVSMNGITLLTGSINLANTLKITGNESGGFARNLLTVNSGDSVEIGEDGLTGLRIRAGGKLGFFTSTGAAKQTVTGSRGSTAALASLLTALSNYGVLTDSST